MVIEKKINELVLERFESHRDFTRVLIDAFVVVNKELEILKYNTAFCQIVNLKTADIKKIVNLDKMLKIETLLQDAPILEQILNSQLPMRIDEVKAITTTAEQSVTLILSTYPYFDDNGGVIGAFILMRDVTAEHNLQTKYKDKALESITDPLTGLYLRRFFESSIEKEIAKNSSRTTFANIAVMMLDLDKFKSINDNYGHQAGDYVLIETAKLLKNNIRRSDIIGRYGGEEMIALVYNATESTALIVAEKFRSAIEQYEYIFEGVRIPVTVSIGVSLVTQPNDTKEAVIKRADACLYQAKQTGRNKVVADFK